MRVFVPHSGPSGIFQTMRCKAGRERDVTPEEWDDREEPQKRLRFVSGGTQRPSILFSTPASTTRAVSAPARASCTAAKYCFLSRDSNMSSALR